MVDANFKLKLKNKGIRDTHLGPGWAYFVHETKFQGYLARYGKEESREASCISTTPQRITNNTASLD